MFSTNIFHWKLKLPKKSSSKGVKRRRSNSAESAEAARDNKRRFSVLPFISNIKFNLNELVELGGNKQNKPEPVQEQQCVAEQAYATTEIDAFKTYSESPTATLDDLPVLDFLSADFSMPEPSSHCMVEGQRVLAKCGSNDETTAREWDIDLKQNYSLNSIEREILALESDSSMLCI